MVPLNGFVMECLTPQKLSQKSLAQRDNNWLALLSVLTQLLQNAFTGWQREKRKKQEGFNHFPILVPWKCR